MKKIVLLIAMILSLTVSYAETTNYINDIKVDANENGVTTIISASQEIAYKVGKLTDSKKVYIDFINTIIRANKTIKVDKAKITTVRAAQNAIKPQYISRVVFDLTEMQEAKITLSEDKKQLIAVFGSPVEPTPEAPKKTIVIDPGHGGKDPGATVSDLYEKTLNLNIALKLQKLLQDDGRFNVIMTRDKDVFVELEDRAKVANENKADLLVVVHNNSMPKNFKGTMTLYNDTVLKSNKDLAEAFQKKVSEALKQGSIGARQRTDLVVLKKSEVPTVLVEVACMTNILERRQLRTENFKQKAAQAIYDSIVQAVIK